MPLSRRRMIASLAALLAQRSPAFAVGLRRKRVIVVGAGLAGLAAARDLAAAGAAVTVLEGRGRIGGRIHTSRAWHGLPMDLGASWIHGTDGNPLTALADAAGAARATTSYDSAIAFGASGNPVDLTAAYRLGEDVIAAARRRADMRNTDQSLKDAVRASAAWRGLDAPAQRLVRHVINGTVEAEYAGAWDEVSAWCFDEAAEFAGPDALFPGGYDQIVQYLAAGLDIRTGSVVAALAPFGAGASVTLATGAQMQADHVVLTVPLGVLKAAGIAFAAPLARRRLRAIATLGMGLLNKCLLRFDRVAWPDDVDWIEWVGPQDGMWSQWLSYAQATGAPVLLAFHAAHQARALEGLSDTETADAAHAALKAMFGADFPAPVAVQVTRWSQDPFSRGSYSFNATGTTPGTRGALAGADWDGRLIFAGEACAPAYWGTAHGAVLSGRSAAAVVAAG